MMNIRKQLSFCVENHKNLLHKSNLIVYQQFRDQIQLTFVAHKNSPYSSRCDNTIYTLQKELFYQIKLVRCVKHLFSMKQKFWKRFKKLILSNIISVNLFQKLYFESSHRFCSKKVTRCIISNLTLRFQGNSKDKRIYNFQKHY